MGLRGVAVVLGLALVAVACRSAGDGGEGQTARSTPVAVASDTDGTPTPDGTTPVDKPPVGTTPFGKPGDTRRNKDAKPYAEAVGLAIDDIQTWWAVTMPAVYKQSYVPIPAGRIYAVTPTRSAPACEPGGGQAPYADYKGNAMFCPLDGGFVVYDDQNLLPALYRDYGEYALAMVFAHEWGHAIQEQNGFLESGVASFVLENQADCFAGAWTRHALDNRAGGFRATAADLQSALAGMLEFRDRPGTDASAESAHGSGFDRVNGFQTGFDEGVQKCATFSTDRPTPYALTFTSQKDLDNKGNLPYNDVVRVATEDLNAYWRAVGGRRGFDFKPVENTVRFASDTAAPKCGDRQYTPEEAVNAIFFCVDDNYVAWDEGMLQGIGQDIGDFGIAVLLARQWAVSAQVQAGLSKAVIESKIGVTQQSCFTGAWTRAVLDGDRHNPGTGGRASFTLSPGDIDEAVQAFLNISETPDSKGTTASASSFEQVKAFREGFLAANGDRACARYTADESAADQSTVHGAGSTPEKKN